MTYTSQIRTLRPYLALCIFGAVAFSLSPIDAKSGLNLDVLARDGYGMVQMRQEENVLLVRATINGEVVNLKLDSGFEADGIAIDDNFTGLRMPTQATTAGTTVTGQKMASRKGMAQTVVMGNVQITGEPLLFGNFRGLLVRDVDQSIETRIHQSTEANGFITSGFLRTNHAIIDLHNLRLYLRPPGTGKPVNLGPALKAAGLSEVSFSQAGHGACLVDVAINGAAGKMVMDTGSFLTVIDNRVASQTKAGVHNGNLELVDLAGVHKSVDVTDTRSFTIGGVPIRSAKLTMNPLYFYRETGGKVIGLLGMDVLGQNWGVIDFGSQKLYFAKAP